MKPEQETSSNIEELTFLNELVEVYFSAFLLPQCRRYFVTFGLYYCFNFLSYSILINIFNGALQTIDSSLSCPMLGVVIHICAFKIFQIIFCSFIIPPRMNTKQNTNISIM